MAAYTSFKDAVLPHLSNPQWQEILAYEMAKRLCYGCGADNHLIKNCPKANVSGGSGATSRASGLAREIVSREVSYVESKSGI